MDIKKLVKVPISRRKAAIDKLKMDGIQEIIKKTKHIGTYENDQVEAIYDIEKEKFTDCSYSTSHTDYKRYITLDENEVQVLYKRKNLDKEDVKLLTKIEIWEKLNFLSK